MKSLIVHIGTGKTGSTSIQHYLGEIRKALLDKKIFYWGLNLDLAPKVGNRKWQIKTGTQFLQRMPLPEASKELTEALDYAIDELPSDGIALWSNESIYENPKLYIPLFSEAQLKHGLDLKLIAYVRSSRSYITSAYKQWGIKHKSYEGSVVGFSEWVRLKVNFLSYGITLRAWQEAFNDKFALVNYDKLDDVRIDFLRHLPGCSEIMPSIPRSRANESPNDLQLALFALYNSLYRETVLPTSIASLISRNQIYQKNSFDTSLLKLFPSKEEVDSALSLFTEDQEIVNSILSEKKQPLLENREANGSQEVKYSSESNIVNGVMSMLLAILVEQEKRISVLENPKPSNEKS